MPLQTKTKVSKVQLRAGEEIEGAFLFVGDKSTNNGMDNKACAIVSSAGHTCLAAGAWRQLMMACRMLCSTGMELIYQHPTPFSECGPAIRQGCGGHMRGGGQVCDPGHPSRPGALRHLRHWRGAAHALPCKMGCWLLITLAANLHLLANRQAAVQPRTLQVSSPWPTSLSPACHKQAMASDDSKDEEQDSSSNASYSTGAGEYSGSGDGQSGGDSGNVPSAPSGDSPEDNPLLDQLLSTQEGGGDFHTTSVVVSRVQHTSHLTLHVLCHNTRPQALAQHLVGAGNPVSMFWFTLSAVCPHLSLPITSRPTLTNDCNLAAEDACQVGAYAIHHIAAARLPQERHQPDRSRVGMDGVNPTTDPTPEQLKQVSTAHPSGSPCTAHERNACPSPCQTIAPPRSNS